MALTSVSILGSLTSTRAVFEWLEIHALCTRQLNLCMVHTATIRDQILPRQSLSALHQCDPCCVRNAKFPLALKEKRPYLNLFIQVSMVSHIRKRSSLMGWSIANLQQIHFILSKKLPSVFLPSFVLRFLFGGFYFHLMPCKFLAVYTRCLHNSQDHRWRKNECVINLIYFIYFAWIDLGSVFRIGFNFFLYKFLHEKIFAFFVLPNVVHSFSLCFICMTSFHSHGMYYC